MINNNYGILEIEETIKEMKMIRLVGVATEATVVRLEEEIVDLLRDYQYPTIHDVLEAMLYYLTWTDKLIEFDYYLTRFLYSKDFPDSTIIGVLNVIANNEILEKIEKFLLDNKVKNERYFNGWSLSKSNLNFCTSFDFILLNAEPLITTRKSNAA